MIFVRSSYAEEEEEEAPLCVCDMSTEHLVSNSERRKSCTTGGLEVLKGGNRSRPPQRILGLQDLEV